MPVMALTSRWVSCCALAAQGKGGCSSRSFRTQSGLEMSNVQKLLWAVPCLKPDWQVLKYSQNVDRDLQWEQRNRQQHNTTLFMLEVTEGPGKGQTLASQPVPAAQSPPAHRTGTCTCGCSGPNTLFSPVLSLFAQRFLVSPHMRTFCLGAGNCTG